MRNEPEKRQRGSFAWFESGEAHANRTEILVYALMVTRSSKGEIANLARWAAAVRQERAAATEMQELWKPHESWGFRNGVSKLFDPIINAITDRAWAKDELAAIASAVSPAAGVPA